MDRVEKLIQAALDLLYSKLDLPKQMRIFPNIIIGEKNEDGNYTQRELGNNER